MAINIKHEIEHDECEWHYITLTPKFRSDQEQIYVSFGTDTDNTYARVFITNSSDVTDIEMTKKELRKFCKKVLQETKDVNDA